MAENERAFLPSTDVPPSNDLQLAPTAANGAAAIETHDLLVPERSLVQEPRWPHPSFGWALLWCLLLVVVTQVPGAILFALIVGGFLMFSPDTLKALKDPAELYNLDVVNVALAVVVFATQLLVIGFSWLIIRLIVGRDWMRQLALRRPSLAHTLLALASFPVLALGGDVSYKLLFESRLVPSVSHGNPFNLVYFWLAVFVVLGAALLAPRLRFGYGWTRRLASRPTRSADVLLTAAVLPLLVLSIILVYEELHRAFPGPSLETLKLAGMEEVTKIFGKWPLGFAVLVIGLGPGIGEELWCRGFLGRGLVGNHGAVLGVLASSFCFGLIHGDPCQGTMAMVMGLWLHFVYLTTRSLLLPMMLHFLNNALSVLAPRVPSLQLLDSKPQNIPLPVYAAALLLLFGVAYALYQSRARLAGKSPEQILSWRPAFEGVECPPADSGMRVVHPMLSPAAAALAFGGLLLFALAFAAWLQQFLHNGG